jgi:hypothetical protein
MLVQRIVVYFLSNPSELDAYPHFKDFTVFKDTSQKWKTAKSHYELESQFHKELLQEEGFDPTVYFDSAKTLRVSFLKLCLLGKERQKFSPCFPDGKAAYINCFGVKYDVAHIERHLKETTDSQLSRWTVADGGKKTSRDINVRTPDCLFRLINILMLDDEVYGRLLAESKSQPTNRRSLDTGKKGNSSFWNDVLEMFSDDEYDIEDFFTGHDFLTIFTSSDGELPDISNCKSKWVTANKLKEWWSRVVADIPLPFLSQ